MPKTKKEKWIIKERERLLKEHHDYLEVIRRNEDYIQNNLWQIGLLHAPLRTLMNQYCFFKDHSFDDDQIEIMSACTGERTDRNPEHTLYSEIKFGMKVLRKEQERLTNEIVEYRQQLKKRGDAADSYKLFLRLQDDEVLSKKYDQENS
tara:strand:+ start:153 stop:599 length:447 start_codon:yes stop_codon:yes gene_type:complete